MHQCPTRANHALGAAIWSGRVHYPTGFRGATGAPVPSRSGGLTGSLTEVDRKSASGTDCPAQGTDRPSPDSSGMFATTPDRRHPSGSDRWRRDVHLAWICDVPMARPGGTAGPVEFWGKPGPDRILRGNRPPDDFPGLPIHHGTAGSHGTLTAPRPIESTDRTRRSETLASPAPDCRHASWRSCRPASAVPSFPPAIMPESLRESSPAFARQGPRAAQIAAVRTGAARHGVPSGAIRRGESGRSFGRHGPGCPAQRRLRTRCVAWPGRAKWPSGPACCLNPRSGKGTAAQPRRVPGAGRQPAGPLPCRGRPCRARTGHPAPTAERRGR